VIDTGSIQRDGIRNAKQPARMYSADVEDHTDVRPEVIHKLGVSSVKVERR
jgi:hypothetical protein